MAILLTVEKQTNSHKRIGKKLYFQNLIAQSKQDTAELWKNANKI